jgi:hypothetical protein
VKGKTTKVCNTIYGEKLVVPKGVKFTQDLAARIDYNGGLPNWTEDDAKINELIAKDCCTTTASK